MDSLRLDLRFALRSLRRRPTFTTVAVATIALSIAAATSIYSVVDGVLFRSLPYHDAGRLVSVWQTDPDRMKQPILAAFWDRVPLDYTDFITWRTRQTSFSAVGAWANSGTTIDGSNGPENVAVTRASPELFAALGVHPIAGRAFLPGEDVVGGPRVTMLSYEAWQSRFGARADVVGSLIRFDDKPYQIIGILPPRFTLERGKPAAPFWIPAGQNAGDVGRRNRSFHAIARLKPGVTLEQAIVETRHLLDASDPASKKDVRIAGFVRDETRDVRAPLLLLLGAVGLLLMIACVNIATLLLGEGAARELELSARVALGATRGRIARQLLTESLLLSLTGSAMGTLVAWWSTKAIVALAPEKIPGIHAVHVDARVLAASLVAAVVTGLLFGVTPAIALSRTGPAALLRAVRTTGGRGRLQRAMIATELALSVVLLVGGGLLTRSLRKLSDVQPGFRTDHLIVVRADVAGNPFADTLRLRATYTAALARIAALPGVAAVTATSTPPFASGSSSSPYLLPGEPDADLMQHKHEVQQRVVVPNFFAVSGIPVLAGRAFDSSDRGDTPPVAIISESAARRDFPNESALGKVVKYQGAWRTIVGIVGDIKYSRLSAADQPSIYTPFSQRLNTLDLFVRTSSPVTQIAPAIRQALHDADSRFIVGSVDPMQSLIARSFAEERFRTALIVLFAVMAAVLAAVGMYGVTARAVSRRTREVGIRVALGATTHSVVRLIVAQTLRGVTAGVAIGTIAALAASRVISPYMFGVSARDPITYAAIVGLLAMISIAASWIPARRAGRVAPATVLRE